VGSGRYLNWRGSFEAFCELFRTRHKRFVFVAVGWGSEARGVTTGCRECALSATCGLIDYVSPKVAVQQGGPWTCSVLCYEVL
jgi:hypothetical protein